MYSYSTICGMFELMLVLAALTGSIQMGFKMRWRIDKLYLKKCKNEAVPRPYRNVGVQQGAHEYRESCLDFVWHSKMLSNSY